MHAEFWQGQYDRSYRYRREAAVGEEAGVRDAPPAGAEIPGQGGDRRYLGNGECGVDDRLGACTHTEPLAVEIRDEA